MIQKMAGLEGLNPTRFICQRPIKDIFCILKGSALWIVRTGIIRLESIWSAKMYYNLAYERHRFIMYKL